MQDYPITVGSLHMYMYTGSDADSDDGNGGKQTTNKKQSELS